MLKKKKKKGQVHRVRLLMLQRREGSKHRGRVSPPVRRDHFFVIRRRKGMLRGEDQVLTRIYP